MKHIFKNSFFLLFALATLFSSNVAKANDPAGVFFRDLDDQYVHGASDGIFYVCEGSAFKLVGQAGTSSTQVRLVRWNSSNPVQVPNSGNVNSSEWTNFSPPYNYEAERLIAFNTPGTYYYSVVAFDGNGNPASPWADYIEVVVEEDIFINANYTLNVTCGTFPQVNVQSGVNKRHKIEVQKDGGPWNNVTSTGIGAMNIDLHYYYNFSDDVEYKIKHTLVSSCGNTSLTKTIRPYEIDFDVEDVTICNDDAIDVDPIINSTGYKADWKLTINGSVKSTNLYGDFNVDASDFNMGNNACSISATTDCGTVTKTFNVKRGQSPYIYGSDVTFEEGVSVILSPVIAGGVGNVTTYVQLYDVNGNVVGGVQSTDFSAYNPITYTGLIAANAPYTAKAWAIDGVGCRSAKTISFKVNIYRGRISGCNISGDFSIYSYDRATCGVSFLQNVVVDKNVVFNRVEWDFGDGTSSVFMNPGETPTYSYRASGTYNVSAKFYSYNAFDRTVCSYVAKHKVYADCTNGVFRILDPAKKTGETTSVDAVEELQGVTVYPNPSEGLVTVALSTDATVGQVTVYNTMGAQVRVENFSGVSTQLDLSELSAGMYIITVKADDKVKTERIMIK